MTPTCDNSNPRYQALIQLLRTAEDIWNASRVFFERWRLSPSQFNILNVLFDAPRGCTQIELSRQLIMNRSNATGLIDRLEARGLVQRTAIPGNRRAHQVILTPVGRELVREILPEYCRLGGTVWDGLSDEHMSRTVTSLLRVSENVKAIAASLK